VSDRSTGLPHLRAAGTSLLLDARGPGPVTVPHWGPDLGDLGTGTLAELAGAAVPAVPLGGQYEPVPVGLLPAPASGDPGCPGLLGSRAGRDFSPLFGPPDVAVTGGSAVPRSADPVAGLALRTELSLAREGCCGSGTR
jgi:alpha-galactosidase